LKLVAVDKTMTGFKQIAPTMFNRYNTRNFKDVFCLFPRTIITDSQIAVWYQHQAVALAPTYRSVENTNEMTFIGSHCEPALL